MQRLINLPYPYVLMNDLSQLVIVVNNLLYNITLAIIIAFLIVTCT